MAYITDNQSQFILFNIKIQPQIDIGLLLQ